jgi:hypothetical protein
LHYIDLGIFLLKENESNLDDAKRFSSDGNLSNGVLFSNNGKYLMVNSKTTQDSRKVKGLHH